MLVTPKDTGHARNCDSVVWGIIMTSPPSFTQSHSDAIVLERTYDVSGLTGRQVPCYLIHRRLMPEQSYTSYTVGSTVSVSENDPRVGKAAVTTHCKHCKNSLVIQKSYIFNTPRLREHSERVRKSEGLVDEACCEMLCSRHDVAPERVTSQHLYKTEHQASQNSSTDKGRSQEYET